MKFKEFKDQAVGKIVKCSFVYIIRPENQT